MFIYHLAIWDLINEGEIESFGYFSTKEKAQERLKQILNKTNLNDIEREVYDIEEIRLDEGYKGIGDK